MKKVKYILFLAMVMFIASCDVEYFDTPNDPSEPPTSALFNNNVKEFVDDFYDQWFSGRFTLVTMQYWTQSEYGDEDRYVYRESQRQTWQEFYWNMENLRKVIFFNTNEETQNAAAAYGPNINQIATTRIMMAWAFNIMTDTWGDIPYYSFGNDDPDFQALNLADVGGVENEIITPAYATQEKIYADILNELKEATEMMDDARPGFTEGDNIYDGDMSKWKKFANSLRLRIALKIREVNSQLADQHINEISESDVFQSNDDNAIFVYESSDGNASPFYRAFNVDNRRDFAMAHSFITLLQGNNLVDTLGNDISSNPFSGMVDPRIGIYAQQNEGFYAGMPVVESSAEAATIRFESLPGDAIINTPDYGQTLMDYAEVLFIRSELENWDQTHYENGVRASMEKWGVPTADIDDYISNLPAASEESVLTQKYIAMYMQAHTAWAEYRRTGFPQTLVMPYQDFQLTIPGTTNVLNFVFEPLVADATDIPFRMRYPQFEQTLNGENRAAAVSGLTDGDAITSKLWWDVN